ncbi:FucU-like protein [Zootermopsis nevadensis]|uniref:L-fucose mutarotase n=2 Tax=Zootermopsis nevadensis TaxID=136037 RepID=A0A067QXC6_ZOONE|nr:FucU-like protein [Zootermopsis nevadensis]
MPLDKYGDSPVTLMAVTDADVKRGVKTPIWGTYQEIINRSEGREVPMKSLERFSFYERAKNAYAVVNTGETKIYANIVLKMGIIVD